MTGTTGLAEPRYDGFDGSLALKLDFGEVPTRVTSTGSRGRAASGWRRGRRDCPDPTSTGCSTSAGGGRKSGPGTCSTDGPRRLRETGDGNDTKARRPHLCDPGRLLPVLQGRHGAGPRPSRSLGAAGPARSTSRPPRSSPRAVAHREQMLAHLARLARRRERPHRGCLRIAPRAPRTRTHATTGPRTPSDPRTRGSTTRTEPATRPHRARDRTRRRPARARAALRRRPRSRRRRTPRT